MLKKTYTIFLIFSFLLNNHSSISAQTDLETEGLKSKVKTITTTVYRSTVKEGKIKLLGVSQYQKTFFNRAGFLDSTEYQINSLSLGKGPNRKIVYILDKNNNCIKKTNYKNGVEGMSIQYIYKNGQIKEAKYFQAGQDYLGTEYFSYDKYGNKLTANSTDTEGKSLQKSEFTYTKNKRLSSCKKSEGKNVISYKKYEYPKKKEEKIIQIDLTTKKAKSYTINTFDKNKNIISSIDYSSDGQVEKKRVNQYNKNGNRTLRQVFDAEGKEENYNYMRYEYSYDKKGNWIQQVEFLKNGNSLDVTKRKIEYYH